MGSEMCIRDSPFSEQKQEELRSIVAEYIADYREAAAALRRDAFQRKEKL